MRMYCLHSNKNNNQAFSPKKWAYESKSLQSPKLLKETNEIQMQSFGYQGCGQDKFR